jgi:ferredoxin
MSHIITSTCASCKDTACMDVCPVDCIYPWRQPTDTQYHIDPQECIDCGLCVDACPVEAIYPEEEVPAAHQGDIAKSYQYFDYDPPR